MIIVGEKINATIPKINTMIQNRDGQKLTALAQKQAHAGADYIDVNVAIGVGTRDDEISAMKWAVETIQKTVSTPLCFDSADQAVLETGLDINGDRPAMINSTKAEDESLNKIIPLAVHYNTALVALAMDEQGIPKTVKDRLSACEKIARACQKFGFSLDNLFFDPLVLPVSTDIRQGQVTLDTLAEIKEKFPGAQTVMGLSNISYGLPNRAGLNSAFLHMAVSAGLDAAIMDPLDEQIMGAVRTAEVLVGKDRHCRRYTRTFRQKL
ncbi:MAG: dihydropteroate synthase [Desulfobacterales bacterium]